MTVFLDGVAAQFYRGIGAEAQFIAPFSRMNFFIGANNSGKSIVLNLLASQIAGAFSNKIRMPLEGPEIHRARETGTFHMAVGKPKDKVAKMFVGSNETKFLGTQYGRVKPLFKELEKICGEISRDDFIWAELQDQRKVQPFPNIDPKTAQHWTTEWQAIWSAATDQGSGGLLQHWIPETLNRLAQQVRPQSLPSIHLIPAKRIFGAKGEIFEDLSGRGLIDHLATLQNPSWNKQEDREKFERINHFLREVTGKADATLEVPSEREHLLVHMDNKVLPLSSLGTGIHEVVLIAAFCTIYDESIMCLEEPEIHLHPLLQRKLVNYLINNTNSQYFIATHSSAFIDTPGANIFHVTNDGEQTRIKAVLTKEEQRQILDDLGYHASDILQANAVIWVEGPSDRIYLNHWLKAVDDRLNEGIHYTIMFYGGSLIRHLTASDVALDEFIRLRDLNRNMAILLDSDRESEGAPLKPHAQRLVEEMGDGAGIVWVTEGREIENYIDGELLQLAMERLHPKLFRKKGSTGKYDNAFHFSRENPKKPGALMTYKDGDKVGAANLICKSVADLDRHDLRARLEELRQMLCKANGLNFPD